MKPTVTNPEDMGSARIDRILAAEDGLLPSSGFLASVMERIQEEAAAPQPIPFPWKRAIPGILLAVAILGWGLVELFLGVLSAARTVVLAPPHFSPALLRPAVGAGWVALALAASLLSWLFSRRLAGRSGLL